MSLGHEVKFLNRRKSRNSKIKHFVVAFKWLIADNLPFLLCNKKFSNLSKFKKKRISCILPATFSSEQLSHQCESEHFGAVIVGSDQIWRYTATPAPLDSFLAFVPNGVRKIAYAASFGTDVWEFPQGVTEIVSQLAKKIDRISVREESGVALCREHLGVDAIHLLDPTMLLSSDDYAAVLSDYNKAIDINGTFAYILDPSSDKRKLVESCALAMGGGEVHYMHECKDNSVYQWLKAFKTAKCVVTDSFHGTVFSIIFKRPFIVIANEKRGRARFDSILSILNLQGRLIEDKSTDDEVKNACVSVIDWQEVDCVLNEYREKSMSFLKKAL